MFRKVILALFLMTVSFGLVAAEEFVGIITKIDGDKVTFVKFKKGDGDKKFEKGEETTLPVAKDAKMHTPYGATECLPVSTIEASEVLGETAARTDEGAGVCVGHKFASIDWRVITITDVPIATFEDAIVAAGYGIPALAGGTGVRSTS